MINNMLNWFFFNLKNVSLKDEKNLDPNLGSWAEKVLKGNL